MDNDELKAVMGITRFGKRKQERKQEHQRKKRCWVEYEATNVKSIELTHAQRLELNVEITGTNDAFERFQELDVVMAKKLELEKAGIPPVEYRRYRAMSNPFEGIGHWKFVNRSAMKLAELDARLELTCAFHGIEKCSFVDLCGAPGGFCEYLVYRSKKMNKQIRGFGISLQPEKKNDPLNWRLDEKTLENVMLSFGKDGTGNLYNMDNIDEFTNQVLKEFSKGVDLVVADGGFQEARNHSNQENMMHRLVLCEVLQMCRVLCTGGHFVCKTFELTSAFSMGLLYILYHNFETLCIFKPITSRPASSERYVVCKGWKTFQPSRVIEHLTNVNLEFAAGHDVHSLVPMSQWSTDTKFINYVHESTRTIAISQAKAIQNILEFASNESEYTSTKINPKQIYKAWNLVEDV